jgi:LysM repeat protein
MTNAPHPIAKDQQPGLKSANAPISVGDIDVKGNLEGNIVIGNNNKIYSEKYYNYTIHNNHGVVVNHLNITPTVKLHSRKQKPPRPPRNFIGRAKDLAALINIINAKDAGLVFGQDGIGKTTLIRQAANSEAAKAMPDGVVFLEGVEESGKILGLQDVTQLLFDALYESNPPQKITLANARTYLSDTHPLAVLDRFELPFEDLRKLPDLFPEGALLATRRESPPDEVFQCIELTPLAREESIHLLALKSGITVDKSNRGDANKICEFLGDIPLAIVTLANTMKNKGIALGIAADKLSKLNLQENVQAGIELGYRTAESYLNEDECNMLAMVATAPGISVDRPWLESIAGGEKTANSLESMELLKTNSPRLRLSDGMRQITQYNIKNTDGMRELHLDHIVSECKTRALDFDFVFAELGNILGLIQWAASKKRWSDVISLGKTVDPYLTLTGLWDVWEIVLKQVLTAAKYTDNRVMEAWALHQVGSRAIGLGNVPQARSNLSRSLQIRQSIGDRQGAAYTLHNLKLLIIFPPPPSLSGWTVPVLLLIGAVIAAFMFLRPPLNPCPKPDGWQIYRVQQGDSLESISQRVAYAIDENLFLDGAPIIEAVIQNANTNCDDEGITTKFPSEERYPIYVPADPAPPTVIPPVSSRPPTETVPDRASLRLTVKAGSGTYNTVGQVINFQYEVTNSGGTAIGGPVTVSDNKTVVTCPPVNTVGNMNGDLDPGEKIDCTSSYAITQADLNAGSVTSNTTASAGGILSNTATTTVSMNSAQVLELTITANPNTYNNAGQVISFSYNIRNSGENKLGPAQFVVHDDRLGTFNCAGADTSLAPDASITCSATYTTSDSDRTVNELVFTANASGGGATTIQAVSTTITNINTMEGQNIRFGITKLADPVVYHEAGQVITYTYTIQNTGNVPLSWVNIQVQDDHINDNIPFDCGPQPANLALGASASCIKTYVITPADMDARSVTNRASVSVSAFGIVLLDKRTAAVMEGQTATTTISYVLPPVLKKTADREIYDAIGQVITYTYEITNINNVDLTGPITVEDNKVNVSCPTTPTVEPIRINFPAGSPTVTFSGTVTAAKGRERYIFAATQGQSLSVTLTASAGDLRLAIATTGVVLKAQDANLTWSGMIPANGDYFIDIVNISTEDHLYELTVVLSANGGTIPIPTPPGSNGNLDPNETISCIGTHTISQSDLDIGSVTNTATAYVGEIASNTETVTVVADQKPGLKLTKLAEPSTYNTVNQAITYTYVIVNNGNVTLSGLFQVRDDQISDNIPFPCGSESNSLPPGAELTCTATYNIAPADLDRGSVTNNATASWGEISSSASATVTCPPPPPSWVPYVILQGDSLYRISQWYRGINADRLSQANCLSSDKIFTGQNIYVPSSPPSATITGFVQDSAGRRLSGITITLLNNGIAIATRTTNTNGEYSFTNLNAGTYKIFQAEIYLRWGVQRQQNFVIIPEPAP